MTVRPIHEYGADITAADVRAAVATVVFDDEAPGALRASDGIKGLLRRLAIAAGDQDLPEGARLVWEVDDRHSSQRSNDAPSTNANPALIRTQHTTDGGQDRA